MRWRIQRHNNLLYKLLICMGAREETAKDSAEWIMTFQAAWWPILVPGWYSCQVMADPSPNSNPNPNSNSNPNPNPCQVMVLVGMLLRYNSDVSEEFRQTLVWTGVILNPLNCFGCTTATFRSYIAVRPLLSFFLPMFSFLVSLFDVSDVTTSSFDPGISHASMSTSLSSRIRNSPRGICGATGRPC